MSSPILITEAEQNLSKVKNEILYASYSLGVLAQDIVQLLIAQIRNEDTELYTFRIYLSDLQKGLGRRIVLTDFKKACKELLSNTILLNNAIEERELNWLQETYFHKVERYYDFTFSPKVKNYLLNFVLTGGFTIIDKKYFFAIKSSYAKRIYMILKNMTDIAIDSKGFKSGYYKTSVENLRYLLNIEDTKYIKFADFNRRVIKVIETQINDHSDLKIKVELEKKGNKVSNIKFLTQRKYVKTKLIESEKVVSSLPRELNEEILEAELY